MTSHSFVQKVQLTVSTKKYRHNDYLVSLTHVLYIHTLLIYLVSTVSTLSLLLQCTVPSHLEPNQETTYNLFHCASLHLGQKISELFILFCRQGASFVETWSEGFVFQEMTK